MEEQLLRITLPADLLGEIDRQLASEGSLRSRADFVREAVEQRLLEIRFAPAEAGMELSPATALPLAGDPAQPPPHIRLPQPPLADEEDDLSGDAMLQPRRLVDTALTPVGNTWVDPEQAPGFPVEPGPLFLHGRDYPSLWSLAWLARWSDDGPLELGDYLREVTVAAWTFGQTVLAFDRAGPLKVSTAFPTSTRNRDSASQTFEASAVGGLVRRRDGSQVVVGPLALWGVAHVFSHQDRARIAPTRAGLALLSELDGISLQLPHSPEHARIFLRHLQHYAPGDYGNFRTVLSLVATGPRRDQLIAELSGTEVAETPKVADVYAQAYVSRGREWGLIEPKLISRCYRLTELGESALRD